MPEFSRTSHSNLESAEEDLQTLFNEVIKYYDCSVICGHRGEGEQEEAFRKRLSKVQFPNSKHNSYPSRAVDVIPYPVNWGDTHRFYHFGGYVKAVADRLLDEGVIEHEIRWGGDWDRDNEFDDQTFMDFPHFELVD